MLVLVEDPTEAIALSYVKASYLVRTCDKRRQRVQRAGVRDALMRAVSIVELFEIMQGVH